MTTGTESNAARMANQFLSVFKKAAEVASNEKQTLETKREQLAEQAAALQQQMRDIDKQLGQIENDTAVALKIAAKEAGVKLTLENRQGKSAPASGGKRPRMTKDEVEVATSALLKALPDNDGEYVGVSELAEKAGIDATKARTILQKLKKNDQAESNGMRGTGGGWHRA